MSSQPTTQSVIRATNAHGSLRGVIVHGPSWGTRMTTAPSRVIVFVFVVFAVQD
jgi:hypothetical protein